MSCERIQTRLVQIAGEMDALENLIEGQRAKNQALGYFSGVLFPPLVLGMTANEQEKRRLDANQAERDGLLHLHAANRCPLGSIDPATGRVRGLHPADR